MKFVTYAHNGAEKVGILHHTEEYIIHMSDVIKSIDPAESLPETMQACIELGDRFVDQCRQALKWIDDQQDEGQKYLLPVQDVRLLAKTIGGWTSASIWTRATLFCSIS